MAVFTGTDPWSISHPGRSRTVDGPGISLAGLGAAPVNPRGLVNSGPKRFPKSETFLIINLHICKGVPQRTVVMQDLYG